MPTKLIKHGDYYPIKQPWLPIIHFYARLAIACQLRRMVGNFDPLNIKLSISGLVRHATKFTKTLRKIKVFSFHITSKTAEITNHMSMLACDTLLHIQGSSLGHRNLSLQQVYSFHFNFSWILMKQAKISFFFDRKTNRFKCKSLYQMYRSQVIKQKLYFFLKYKELWQKSNF